MAAVVASLAAFLAGGVPAFSGTGYIANSAKGELPEGRGRRHDSEVWAQPDEEIELLSAAPAIFKGRRDEPSKQAEVDEASEHGSWPFPEDDSTCCELSAESDEELRRSIAQDRKRSVRFDLSKNTEHHITPYSEVYGIHPREFDYCREGCTLTPMPCFLDPGCSSDSDSEDEEETREKGWQARAFAAVGLRPVPQHTLVAACCVVFLFRAFGEDLLHNAVFGPAKLLV